MPTSRRPNGRHSSRRGRSLGARTQRPSSPRPLTPRPTGPSPASARASRSRSRSARQRAIQRRRRRAAILAGVAALGVLGAVVVTVIIPKILPGKSAAAIPVHYSVGIARCTFVDHSRTTPDYRNGTSTPGRVLVTEIRYPTLSPRRGEVETPNAHPAVSHGPFPLVVFGQGYALTPGVYAKLLDRWVDAGFVVAAPLFPDTSKEAVAALAKSEEFLPEADDVNQPGDMAYVAKSMIAATSPTSSLCPIDHHLVDHSKVALAGQSDGATSAVALAFDPRFAAFRGSYRAVVDLSGELFGAGTNSPDTLVATKGSPALFVSQSATDTCNPPQFSRAIYNAVHIRDKWFLKIANAHHLPPYIGTDRAAFSVVAATTTAFLKDAFTHDPASKALLKLGNANLAVAALSTGSTAPPLAPLVQGPGSCYLTS